jgi:hypothetical protein
MKDAPSAAPKCKMTEQRPRELRETSAALQVQVQTKTNNSLLATWLHLQTLVHAKSVRNERQNVQVGPSHIESLQSSTATVMAQGQVQV